MASKLASIAFVQLLLLLMIGPTTQSSSHPSLSVASSFVLGLPVYGNNTRNNNNNTRNNNNNSTRSRRSVWTTNQDLACDMLIAFDEPLFRHFNQDLDQLTELARKEVKLLNDIYHRTLLRGPELGRIYFRIKEVRILFDFCVECNQTQDVFLTEFSKMDTSSFCLGHLFTFRDFPDGLQGLAWKGQVCRKQFNTGFTTLLNHQVQSTLEQSAMTFSHEVGHNLGADHDENLDCPSGYIMSEQGSRSSTLTFSSCSLNNMSSELRKVLSKPRLNCFKASKVKDNQGQGQFSVCGDGLVEGEEECDCGIEYQLCDDPCCYPAHIDPWDVWMNETAVPCRRNRKVACLEPFRSVLHYGLIAPWVFIATSVTILSIFLLWDWKHRKMCYGHLKTSKSKPEVNGGSPRKRPEISSPKRLDINSSPSKKPNIIKRDFSQGSPVGVTQPNDTPSSPFLPSNGHWPTDPPFKNVPKKPAPKGPPRSAPPPPPPLPKPNSNSMSDVKSPTVSEDIDLVPRRRAPLPPTGAVINSPSSTNALASPTRKVDNLRSLFETMDNK